MPKPKELLEDYEHLAEKYPLTKMTADLLPVVGVGTAAADVAANVAKGHYGDAALDALGVVPVFGRPVAKGLKALKASEKALSRSDKAVETSDRAAKGRAGYIGADRTLASIDPSDYEYSDPMTGHRMKKGGKVSVKKPVKQFRGDGIAQRGKTRGRIV